MSELSVGGYFFAAIFIHGDLLRVRKDFYVTLGYSRVQDGAAKYGSAFTRIFLLADQGDLD